MESSIRSLYRELNAFEKSSFNRIESSAISPRKCLAACTAASHQPGTPTPTCRGDRYSTTLGTVKALAHLAANLRHNYPITIGRRPPRLLRSASRVPPKSDARTWSGQVPAKSKFVRDVIAESSSGPDCAHVTISRVCGGRKPSGLPDEPFGKVRMQAITSASVAWKGVLVVGRGIDGRSGGEGCFKRSSSSVSSFIGAGLSSEHRILAAALMLPSSSFAAPAAARACSPPAPRRPAAPDSWLYCGAKRFVSPEGAAENKFSTRALILDVRLWRFPPLTVCVSVNAPKDRRRRHGSGEKGSKRIRLMTVVSKPHQLCLAALGMCLRSLCCRVG